MKKTLAIWAIPVVLCLAISALGYLGVHPWGGCPTPKRARVAASVETLRVLTEGIALWHDETGTYPAPCHAPRVPVEVAVLGSDFTRRKRGLTDGWENEYRYASTGAHYVLYSFGPDGRPGETYARLLPLADGTDAEGMCQVASAAQSDDLVVFDGQRCSDVVAAKPSANVRP